MSKYYNNYYTLVYLPITTTNHGKLLIYSFELLLAKYNITIVLFKVTGQSSSEIFTSKNYMGTQNGSYLQTVVMKQNFDSHLRIRNYGTLKLSYMFV